MDFEKKRQKGRSSASRCCDDLKSLSSRLLDVEISLNMRVLVHSLLFNMFKSRFILLLVSMLLIILLVVPLLLAVVSIFLVVFGGRLRMLSSFWTGIVIARG